MTYVVVGANRGIGLELARQLSDRGEHVIATCRKPSVVLDNIGVTVIDGIDVTSDESAAKLAAAVKRVKVLIVNAGVLKRTTAESLDYDSLHLQMEVNAIGPLRVVLALKEKIAKGGKVGIISSRMGSIEDNTSGSHYGYRMSKCAANMAGVSLARDLADDKIAVALLHPGYVRTDMTGNTGHIDADESARGLIERMDELTMATTGKFWHVNGDVLPF